MVQNLLLSYSPGSNRNNLTGYAGYTFTPSQGMSVTALGARMATGNTSVTVDLCNGAGTILATASVSFSGGTVGNFYYTSITPVTLTAATAYYLVIAVTNSGANWSDSGVSSLNSFVDGPTAITATTLGTWNTGTRGNQYAGVDLEYNSSGSVTIGVSISKSVDYVVVIPYGVKIAKSLDYVVLSVAKGPSIAKSVDYVVLESVYYQMTAKLSNHHAQMISEETEFMGAFQRWVWEKQHAGAISVKTAYSLIVG